MKKFSEREMFTVTKIGYTAYEVLHLRIVKRTAKTVMVACNWMDYRCKLHTDEDGEYFLFAGQTVRAK